MKLISADEAIDFLGVRDVSDLRDSLSFLLDRVTTGLQSVLETEFSEVAGITDVFQLGEGEYIESQSSILLVLSHALITSAAVDINIKTAADYADLATADASTVTPFVDTDRGHIRIINDGTFLTGNYVSVTYDCGLQVDTDDPSLYVGVPSWLRDAASAYTFEAYHAHKTLNTDSGRVAYKSVSGMRLPKVVPSVIPPPSPGVMGLLSPYLRFSSVGVKALGSY